MSVVHIHVYELICDFCKTKRRVERFTSHSHYILPSGWTSLDYYDYSDYSTFRKAVPHSLTVCFGCRLSKKTVDDWKKICESYSEKWNEDRDRQEHLMKKLSECSFIVTSER